MTSDERREALIKLAEDHKIRPGDQCTAARSLAYYLDNPMEIWRWAAVTRVEATRSTTVETYPRKQLAQEAAAAYIADDIHPMVPVEVVDLDTGAKSEPTIQTQWSGEEDVFVKGMTEVFAEENAFLALEQIAELGDAPFPDHPEKVPTWALGQRIELMGNIAKARQPLAEAEDGGS
jgi:hypothetical protein